MAREWRRFQYAGIREGILLCGRRTDGAGEALQAMVRAMSLEFARQIQALALAAQAETAEAAESTAPAVDPSMKTDPIALPFLFLICLAIPVAIIGRFELGRAGCIVLGLLFAFFDFFITLTAMLAGMTGVGTGPAFATALGSGGLLGFLVIAFGQKMGAWFRKHEATPRTAKKFKI